jgi:hypothetical protein
MAERSESVKRWLEGQTEERQAIALFLLSIQPEPLKRACPHCGGLFAGHPNRVYCSKVCRQRALRRRHPRYRHWERIHGPEEPQDERWS